MADDKSEKDMRDRHEMAGLPDYEVAYFAKRHKITTQQAERLIAEYGNSRQRLEEEAAKLSRKPG